MKRLLFSLLCASAVLAQVSLQYDQVGYSPKASKVVAIHKARGDSLYVYAEQGGFVGAFGLGPKQFWDASQDSVRLVDLSVLNKEGRYSLTFPATSKSYPFVVRTNPYREVTDAALKFFYLQRSSTALPVEFAGAYTRPAGHPDTAAILHPSTGETGTIRSPKGWYDAGDYGKYIVNSGISTFTLLTAYEQHSKRFQTSSMQIPESNNNTPDILDEIRWNLDWMLTMQAKDGGVYHKLTTLRFCGDLMPDADTSARYVIGKGTAATFNFAAVMARASLVYAPFDQAYAKQMLAAARKAYQWGLDHPDITYQQPQDVQTGQYGDGNLTDERFWASVEMTLATQGKEPEFLRQANIAQERIKVPQWSGVGALGYYTAAMNPKLFGTLGTRAKSEILYLAKELVQVAQTNPYAVSINGDDHIWGSNAILANQAIVLLHAYALNQDTTFRNVARNDLHYLLGKNPLAISYVTGYGVKTPMNPHHRPSTADAVVAPIPGMLAGGPHDGGQDVNTPDAPAPWKCVEYRIDNAPAKDFIDHRCSYATNEVAINWNAPLVYLAVSFEE